MTAATEDSTWCTRQRGSPHQALALHSSSRECNMGYMQRGRTVCGQISDNWALALKTVERRGRVTCGSK